MADPRRAVGTSKMGTLLFVAVYLGVSALVFSVFMGVPVFNVVVGLVGCLYLMKRKATRSTLDKFRLFSCAVLLFVSALSAYIALTDKYTAANLEGMFGLGFHVTAAHLWVIVLVGGGLLLLVNDVIIRAVARART